MKFKIPYLLKGIVSLGYNSISKILPAYLSSIGFSPLSVAAVNSSYQLAKGASGILSGPLIDKFGWLRSFRFSMLAIMLILILFLFFAKTDMNFILLFFGIGITLAIAYFSIDAIATDAKNKIEILSNLEFFYQIGFVFGPLIGGFLVKDYGFEIAVMFWIVSALIGLFLSFLIPVSKENKKIHHDILNEIKKSFSQNPINFIAFLALSGLFIGFIEGVRDIAIPLYAHDLGMDIVIIGTIFTISAIITAIGILPLGKISNKIGSKHWIILGLVVVFVAFACLSVFKSFIEIAVLTGILSLGRTMGYIGTRSFVAENMPSSLRATAFSIQQSFFSVGLIIGPLFSGFIIEWKGIGSIFIILAVFTTIVVLFLGCVLLFNRIKTYSSR